jgi:dienelactone hydrolase
MRTRATGIAVVASLFLVPPGPAAQAPAEAWPRGQIIYKVTCREDAAQSYALYLPSLYSAERDWPILYCLDPGARGRIPVERFQEGAEEYGYIVAGSNNSRNGPFEICTAAMKAVWEDTHARFAVSDKGVFGAGMSGGARSICSLALTTGLFSGVVACAAGLPGGQPPGRVPFFFFGAAGVDDFNYPELLKLDGDLEKLGAVKRIVTFQGGHEWAPKAVCTQAIEWLELQSMKTGLRPKDEALIRALFGKAVASVRAAAGDAVLTYHLDKDLAADFRGLEDVSEYAREAEALASSKQVKAYLRDVERQRSDQTREMGKLYSLWKQRQDAFDEGLGQIPFAHSLSLLKKEAEAPKDSSRRRVARRVLQGLYVDSYQRSQSDLERNNYADAADLLGLAAAIRPDSPTIHYNLATVCAKAGNKRQALEALKQAIQKGFKDARKIREDPAFEPLRNDPGMKKLLEGMRPAVGN